jgi:hypothetical protein
VAGSELVDDESWEPVKSLLLIARHGGQGGPESATAWRSRR